MLIHRNKNGKGLGEFSRNNGLFRRVISNLIQNSVNPDNEKDTMEHAFKMTEGRCFFCGEKLYYTDMEGNKHLVKSANLDHIIPANVFGLLVKGNAALTCRDCNCSKSNIPAIEYFNLRYNARQITLYDTPKDFQDKLDEFYSEYSQSWPMMAMLNKQIENGDLTEISLETIIMCASVNPADKSQFMIPVNYSPQGNAKFESNDLDSKSNHLINQLEIKRNEEIKKEKPLFWATPKSEVVLPELDKFSPVSIEMAKLIEWALINSPKSNEKKLESSRRSAYSMFSSIEKNHPDLVNKIGTVNLSSIIDNSLFPRTSGQMKNFNVVATIMSELIGNPGLIMNEEFLIDFRNLKLLNK